MRAGGRLLILPFLVVVASDCRRASESEAPMPPSVELRAGQMEVRAKSVLLAPNAPRTEPRRVASAPKSSRAPLPRSEAHRVRLDRGGVRVPVPAPDLTSGRRIHLTLRDCITDLAPGINYQVFLGEPSPEHYVGGITFFDAVRRRVTDRLGDVTDIAERLAAEGGAWEVTIVPVGVASRAAHPTVGDVLLVSR
ncbi:hypothetical protein AKJ09_05287 [Labilithrix luteola]|uniref:Uncharacterized protein n=1 Tax=Labilithrix luteola TaxID=1391654 RepID=A0A0K1PYL5_9BACT|nr:hypothetical protein [Labilithrix luteola]AKU98623.1 hypothetical protein AKJ09_05287 [Labilithrix luteola]